MFGERQSIAAQCQNRKDKGLDKANEQAEHYPELRNNPRRQLVKNYQQNFACQNVTEKTKCHSQRFGNRVQQVQHDKAGGRLHKMFKMFETLSCNAYNVSTKGD